MLDQSWRPATAGTINRSLHRILRLIVRAIVASEDRMYDQSYLRATDRTINRCDLRPIVRSVGAPTIWNHRLEVLNMTIDLATTDFALAITHDLYDQSYVLSTICPRFQHISVAGRSLPGRNPDVTGALGVLNMTTTLLRLILPWRSPTTSATSCTFFLRFAHDSNIFRPVKGRS